MRKGSIVFVLILALLAGAGCARSARPTPAGLTPEAFLKQYDLAVDGEPVTFSVTVPGSWAVAAGEYPIGLYWGLANVFSKDAGLDLSPLKGQTVEVRRYSLAGGLPGEGSQSEFRYPSQAVLLVRDEKVAGAWLTFNVMGVGPSVRKRSLQEVTGLTFEEWSDREGYFADLGPNADLAKLGPAEVLAAFLDAISTGDKRRANACLSPRTLRDALTVNMGQGKQLYNPDFGKMNSLVENIRKGRLIGYKLMDPDSPSGPFLADIGDRRRIELAATLELTWRDEIWNTPGETVRFAILQKQATGWKLEGLGTGP